MSELNAASESHLMRQENSRSDEGVDSDRPPTHCLETPADADKRRHECSMSQVDSLQNDNDQCSDGQ